VKVSISAWKGIREANIALTFLKKWKDVNRREEDI
jgi:hypothetical protein